ncbi:ABC transporter substrate-binding protein [Fusibacter ferrireducens]|uniref:ABC transporter substrate-binding protein n=1 Tax=Fusibacter ferrireducens TaxID=2785058 RepID=A0ABR9ZXY4_9FIRM|nr:ABC transporter substrate-binding protein [Fusibacter ferrireducens]MBF4695013.1 ABC transporter substrate-binding protein [Fusibacter ferrireducens]
MKKRLATLLLCLAMVFTTLTGCGSKSEPAPSGSTGDANANTNTSTSEPAAAPEATVATTGGIIRSVEGFAYATLDPHKDYNSWHSQKYGLTESLFKLGDDMKIQPWLAKSLEIKDTVAVLTLNDGVCFSNGTPLTADMVKRNLERLSEVNKRFKFYANFTMEATDDKTLTITMPEVMPTLENEMASPEACMLDLDATTDIDNAPISTGPFAVDVFIPEGDITLKRNDNYWGGHVNLDGAKFFSMRDGQSKLMAMQNGEIDAYDSLSATDIEIFSAEPDRYQLFSVPSQARTYMFLNPKTVPESVRQAVILTVDRESISAFMGGTVSPSYGAYNESTPYGKVQYPSIDLAKAKEIMEADGYTLNSNNVYEKNGVELPTIGLYCYAARSIDSMAVLIKEQLTNSGIPAEIKLVEDPDGTYMTDKQYDICFYRMTTDKTGDPLAFIDGVVRSGSYQDITGYGNAATDAQIEELRFTIDSEKRAEIANAIMQDYTDAAVFCPLVTYNRNIVMSTGVTHFAETNPYEFYTLDANTTAPSQK